MKVMFRTGWGTTKNPIEELNVIKVSKFSVWYKGKNLRGDTVSCRELLKTSQHEWHMTKEEAKSHLIEKAKRKVSKYVSALAWAENDLNTLLECLQ